VRRDDLVEVIASKPREGDWVESKTETELVALGRRRWFGVFGGRAPESGRSQAQKAFKQCRIEKRVAPKKYVSG